VWFIGIVAVALVVVAVIEGTEKAAVTPYSAFLDQLEAGNVASVTFQGTEIDGRFKQAASNAPSTGKAQSDAFRTHVPDFGDPALIPELRRQHVVIDVSAPSPWTSVLARIPWPMLILVGAILVAGLVRLVRGGKARSGPAASMPAPGMIGLVSSLFGKQPPAASPPPREGDEPKSR
jgi:ATP-dependent Zn protease